MEMNERISFQNPQKFETYVGTRKIQYRNISRTWLFIITITTETVTQRKT